MPTEEVVKGKRGRKQKPINFRFNGNRPFTVLDVFNRYAKTKNRISKVAINVRLTQMVEQKQAKVVGKKTGRGRGRPFNLFQLV